MAPQAPTGFPLLQDVGRDAAAKEPQAAGSHHGVTRQGHAEDHHADHAGDLARWEDRVFRTWENLWGKYFGHLENRCVLSSDEIVPSWR